MSTAGRRAETEHNAEREVGLGASEADLEIYLANRPQLDDYPTLNHLKPLLPGELAHIVANTSNHWRKVFNVYAKFLEALNWHGVTAAGSWQDYRDQGLLQSGSREMLLFSRPVMDPNNTSRIHIIAGKTYAAQLSLPPLTWLDAHFAINREARLIVCPYLDYRQLSNERIERLANLVRELDDVG
ncbi:DUF6942 family protein [Pseudomaricurvus sp.]|uniref:DUF6942 family protein n=1 Tax=Pseudomaricurvus sp. TaxID=2004510 RepID=UPI003F6C5FC6